MLKNKEKNSSRAAAQDRDRDVSLSQEFYLKNAFVVWAGKKNEVVPGFKTGEWEPENQ